MKKTLSLITSVALVVGMFPTVASANEIQAAKPIITENQQQVNVADNELFVKIEDSNIEVLKEELEKQEINIVEDEEYDNNSIHRIAVQSNNGVNEDILNIIEDSDVVLDAAPIKKYHTLDVKVDKKNPLNDYNYVLNSHYSNKGVGIGADKTRKMAAETGIEAQVAVIDAGFRTTHKEISGSLNMDLAYDAVSDVIGSVAPDLVDHGTAVASTIVGKKNNGIGSYGVCVNTRVIPISACDNEEGWFDDSDLLRALEYVEKIVKTGKAPDLHVVNLSLGCWYEGYEIKSLELNNVETDPIYAQLKRLHDIYGLVITCGGGNGYDNGWDNHTGEDGMIIPGDYDCCVSVTASDYFGMNVLWSDISPDKDLTAPGDGIVVATSESDESVTDEGAGTSFAAPITAGAIVTLMQINPDLSANDAVELLKKTAVPLDESDDNNYVDPSLNGSAGIVNLEAAAYKTTNTNDYWKGYTDRRYYNGVPYGFQVSSTKNKTVTLTMLGDSIDGANFIVPSSVKLRDGNRYKVTKIDLYTIPMKVYNATDNVVIGRNVNALTNDLVNCFSDSVKHKKNLVLKKNIVLTSKKATKKGVAGSFNGVSAKSKIIVKVSSNHNVNLKYANKYKKFFTKKNAGCNVKVKAA